MNLTNNDCDTDGLMGSTTYSAMLEKAKEVVMAYSGSGLSPILKSVEKI